MDNTVRGMIAQSVEHRPFKAVVLGSNPSHSTIFFVKSYYFKHTKHGGVNLMNSIRLDTGGIKNE